MEPYPPDIDDRLLLTRAICHQDRKALAHLYLKYRRRIKSYIASNTNSVEDLTQEVFIQLLAGKGRYDGSSDVNSYLLGIAGNIVRRYHQRKDKIRSLDTVFTRSINTNNPGEDDQQFEKIIKEAITKLHPKEHQAIRLRFIDGLRPKEAAKKAGCSIGAFYKRLERAERNFRKALKNKKD